MARGRPITPLTSKTSRLAINRLPGNAFRHFDKDLIELSYAIIAKFPPGQNIRFGTILSKQTLTSA
jgi:hypothetical protein